MKKQYIITDPCYIISQDIWDNICKEVFDDKPDQYERFNDRVTAELNKLAGTTNAKATDTGFGDWENLIHSSNENKVLNGDFFADSGMVCVVEYTDNIRNAISANDNDNLIENGGIALIETEGDVEIEFDHSDKSWTEITIRDENDVFCSIPSSSTYNDDEEEDDWEDEDEEEDEDE